MKQKGKRMRTILGIVLAWFTVLALEAGMANKFVSQPLDKQMNRDNIVDKIEGLQNASGVKPSATIGTVSELTPDSGDMIAGTYYVVDQATGAIRGYMTATPTEQFPGYYLAFFDASGTFQFGVNADNGQAVAGGGAVMLDANGISVVASSTYADMRSYKLLDGSDVMGGVFGYAQETGNVVTFRTNAVTGKTSYAWIDAQSPSGGRSQVNIAARHNETSPSQIVLDQTNGVGTIDILSGAITFIGGPVTINSTLDDVDTVIRGAGDLKLVNVDAGLDAVAMGGDAESGYKLKVYGKTNLSAGNTYDINGSPHTHAYIANESVSPISTNMLTRNADSVGQGTWVKIVSSLYLYGGTYYNSTSANGDNFTVNFYLPAGTYKLQFNSTKSPDRGIVKVEVGATNLGNTDLYNATNQFLNIVEYTNITIATGGAYAVKFTLNGKNGSSTGYTFSVQGIEFIRTG